ncbi:MAG: aspartate/glutamate racemase family protein [Bryobacteraceae bacterium]
MKTIGLIGGLSWESSAEYYRIINREMQRRLGGTHSAKILMYSFDFGEIEELQAGGKWDDARDQMIAVGKRLAAGGADFLVICSNTMHRMADAVEWQSRLPLLHIADPTGEKIRQAKLKRIALLGTAYTMEQDFYKGRLKDKYGLEITIPNEDERALIHRVIYEELTRGQAKEASRAAFRKIMERLASEGAQGIILGCTEIMMLVKPEDCAAPLFDTTTLHALAAVDLALA